MTAAPDIEGAKAAILDRHAVADPEALGRVGEALRAQGATEVWAKLLGFAAERAPDPEIGRRIWHDAAEAWMGLGQKRLAESFHQRVVSTDPGHQSSLRALFSLLMDAGRWEEAAEVGQRVAESASGPEGARAYLTLAELVDQRLGQTDRALRALRNGHAADPHFDPLLDRAFELLFREKRWLECRGILEQREAAGAQTLEAQRRLGTALVDEALFHPLALEALERARALGDAEALAQLDALADVKSSWRERAQDRVAQGLETREKSRAADLYVGAAQLYLVYGEDELKADELVHRAIMVGGAQAAMRFYESVALSQGPSPALNKRLDRLLAAVTEPTARAEVALRIARLRAGHGADREELLAAFERVLALFPGHREAVGAVTKLLQDEERPHEAAEVLERYLAAARDEYTKLSVHLQLGSMYAEQLGDSHRARSHFEGVLAIRPTHMAAASALRALYLDDGEMSHLLGVLKVLLEYMPDLASRRRVLEEMREVAREVGVEESFMVARRAFELLPAEDGVRQDFVRLGAQTERFLAVASGLEEGARRLGSAALYRAAATLFDERLPRPADAVRCYRAVLSLEPEDKAAQQALEKLLQQQDDPRGLAEVLEQRLSVVEAPERRLVLSRLGDLYARELGDDERAAAAYHQILEDDPSDPGALVALDDLYVRTGDDEGLERVLAKRERIAEGADALVELELRRARLLAERLERPAEAVELFIDALERQPDRPETIRALNALLNQEVQPRPIATALERVYAHQGDYGRQVAMLSVLIQHEPDPSRRRELGIRAAQLSEARLGDTASAFEYLAIALELDPADEEVRDRFVELTHRVGKYDRAARLLDRVARSGQDETGGTWVALGEILEGALGRPEPALAAYRQALEQDPASVPGLAGLERLLVALERHQELAELLEQRMAAANDPGLQARLGTALGGIRARYLEDLDGAAEAFRQVLNLMPDDMEAHARLVEVLQSAGRDRELAKSLARWRQLAPREQRPGLLAREGLALMRARAPAEAAEAFGQALKASPGHGMAVSGLEELLELDHPVAVKAARLLATHYEATDKQPELVRALGREFALGGPEVDRRGLVLRIDELAPEAEETWALLLRGLEEGLLQPGDYDRLLQRARSAEKAKGLAESLATRDDALRVRARLWDGLAANPEQARRSWEALLGQSPGDAEALEALERLTASDGDPRRLAEVLAARADAAEGADAKVDFLRRAASLWEGSEERPEQALEWLEVAAKLQPEEPRHLAEVARLSERLGRADRRIHALKKLTELRTAPSGIAEAQVELGGALRELERFDEAAGSYGEALAQVPAYGPAREGLEALLKTSAVESAARILEPLHRAEGDWARLAATYEALVRVSSDPAQGLERAVAIRALYAERLGAPEKAMSAAQMAFRLSGGGTEHGEAWRKVAQDAHAREDMLADLRRLRESRQVPEDAALRLEASTLDAWNAPWAQRLRVWRALYESSADVAALDGLIAVVRASGAPSELAELLERRQDLATSPDEQVQIGLERARLLQEGLQNPEAAAEVLEQVRLLEPDALSVFEALDELYSGSEDWEAKAALYEQWPEETERGAKMIAAARIRGHRLGQREAAVSVLAEALGDEAHRTQVEEVMEAWLDDWSEEHPASAQHLARLLQAHYEGRGDNTRAVDVLRARFELADGPADRAHIGKELAAAYGSELQRPDLAFGVLQRCFKEQPNDAELRQGLERWAQDGDGPSLGAAFAQAVNQIQESSARLKVARRAMELLPAEDPSRNQLLSVIHELDPSDAEAAGQLEEARRRAGDAEGLVQLYRAQLAEVADPALQAELWEKMARVAETELQDDGLALEAYTKRAALSELGAEARERFAALCSRAEKWSLLQEILESEAERVEDPDALARLWLRLAQVRRDRLEDARGAVEAFGRVLAARPRDPGGVSGLVTAMRVEDAEVQRRASELLIPHLQEAEAWDQMVEALVVQAQSATDLRARKRAFVQAAALSDQKLGRRDKAFEHVVSALEAAPDDAALMDQAEALAELSGAAPRLEVFYAGVPEERWSEETALKAHRWLARHYEASDDVARATGAHEMVLQRRPDDEEALAALERLLEGQGDFTALLDAFQRRVQAASSDQERVALLRQLADLQAHRAQDPVAAMATLRRLLEIEAQDAGALGRLDQLLEATGRHAERPDVLERWTRAVHDEPQRAAEVRLRWAGVESELANLGGADRLLRQNLEALPGHGPSLVFGQKAWDQAEANADMGRIRALGELLAEAHERAGAWSAMTGVLPRLAKAHSEAFRQAAVWERQGEVFARQLQQPELAFSALAKALESLPSAELADRMEALAAETELWEEWADVLEGVLEDGPDPDVARELHRRYARVLDEALDREEAVEAWRRVLEQAPGDEAALFALERRLRAKEQWAALIEILEQRAGASEDGSPIWLEVGHIWAQRLHEPEEAAEAFRRARSTARTDEARRKALEGSSHVLTEDEAGAELLEVLSSLDELQAAVGVAPSARTHLWLRAGAVAVRRGETERATELYQRVLEVEPNHEGAAEALEGLLESGERWSELAGLLQRRVERGGSEAETARAERKLAMIRGLHLGESEEAIEAWKKVLRRRPNDLEALQALRRLHRAAEQWGPLVQVLRAMIPLHPRADESKPIRFELARVCGRELGQAREAAEVGRRILDIEPHTVEELLELEQIFRDAKSYAEAIRVLQRRAEMVEVTADRRDIFMEVGRIYEQEVGRTAGAVQAFSSALQLDPRHQPAFDALVRICEQTGDHRRLVELVNGRLETVEMPEERRALFLQVATLQERFLGSKDLAFTAACSAFSETRDVESREVAERLAAETDNWDVWVDLMAEEVDEAPLAEQLSLRLRIAELAMDEVDDTELAERQLDMALARAPEDRAAGERMALLLERGERWEELAKHLSDQVELSPEPARQVDVLKRLARVTEERLLRLEPAVQAWQRVLDIVPTEEEASAELERIFRTDGRPEALLEALERRFERSESKGDRLAIKMDVARILHAELKDDEGAMEAYREVLEVEPGHGPALEGLETLLVEGERWDELVRAYERGIEGAEAEGVIDLSTRLAGVHEEHRQDPEAAAASLERVLEVDADHLPTLRTLERLARARDQWARAAELLEQIIPRASEEERPALLQRLGGLYAEKLQRPEAAERSLDAALEADPGNVLAMQALEALYEEREDWGALLEMLARRGQAQSPGAESVKVEYRRGIILLEKALDREAARAAFREAIRKDETFVPAMKALSQTATERSAEALEWYERAAKHTPDPADRSDMYYRAAHQALDDLDDVDRAVEDLEAALSADPEHLPAREELAELLFTDEQWEPAELHLMRLVERLDPAESREDLGRHHYRLAYIAERSGDGKRSLSHYLKSYECDSGSLPTLEGLGAALSEAGRHEDAQRILQTILVQHRAQLTDGEVVDLHQQVGALAMKLGQTEKALKAFDKALQIDPEHEATLRDSAELYTSAGRYEEAFEVRNRLIPRLEGDAQFEALLAQGALCRDHMAEPYRAIDAFQQARAMRPDDRRVLEALAPLLEHTRQIGLMVETLGRLAEALPPGPERAHTLIRAGDAIWAEEQNWQKATGFYNQALDDDPMGDGLARLEKLLFEAKQWKALEENYIAAIQRIPKENKRARAALWRSLAGLYARVLKNDDGARQALEVVARLEPRDLEVGMQLAELLRKDPKRKAEAVERLLQLVPQFSEPEAPVRKLYEVHYEQGSYDLAFCGLGALVLRRVATEDEIRAYRHLVDKAPAAPSGGLSDGQWRSAVLHPSCRGPMGQFLAALYRGMPELFSAKKHETGLKKKERVELGGRSKNPRAGLRYFDAWSRVSMALGVPDVEHYHRPGSVAAPTLLLGQPSVLFAGEQHEVFKTMPPRQLNWVLARQLACLRPELALVRALGPGDVLAVLEAATSLVVERTAAQTRVDAGVVEAWRRAIAPRLQAQLQAALASSAKAMLDAGELDRIAQYLEGAEHSVSRAALLVAGDWVVAARGLGEADVLFDVPRDRRVRELMVFSVSPEFAGLRESLRLRVRFERG